MAQRDLSVLNTQIFRLDSWEYPFGRYSIGRPPVAFGIQGPSPFAMTRPVSEHDQPHIRSPRMTAAPTSRLRRARAQEDENHSRKRRFRPWLASVRRPGSARTDQVLEDDGIRVGVFVKRPSSWRLR